MSGQPQQPKWRTTWSTIQVGVLSAAVVTCIVLLVVGDRTLARVWAVALVFFGIALLGHIAFLLYTRHTERDRP
ncbi:MULTISPECIES: hypothetical protein [unclassified Curtobacterium]|uniref:hypothetical protein n=1 Tax=unclassified Curtobacterium TaxID=257496 RepID=UPI003813C2D6